MAINLLILAPATARRRPGDVAATLASVQGQAQHLVGLGQGPWPEGVVGLAPPGPDLASGLPWALGHLPAPWTLVLQAGELLDAPDHALAYLLESLPAPPWGTWQVATCLRISCQGSPALPGHSLEEERPFLVPTAALNLVGDALAMPKTRPTQPLPVGGLRVLAWAVDAPAEPPSTQAWVDGDGELVAWLRLVLAFLEAGQNEEAAWRAREAWQRFPQQPQLALFLAELAWREGRWAEGLQALATCLRQAPQRPEPWALAALLWATLGQSDLAEAAQAQALAGGLDDEATGLACARLAWRGPLVGPRLGDLAEALAAQPPLPHASRRLDVREALPSLAWQGGQFMVDSLAIVNTAICRRLAASGAWRLHTRPTALPHVDPCGPEGDLALAACADDPAPEALDVEVRHHYPPDFSPKRARKLALVLAWEYGCLPKAWRDGALAVADEVWAHCQASRDHFVASGLPAERLRVLPLAPDPVFQPEGPGFAFPTRKAFVFLFVGAPHHRKGIDLLLQAYAQAFGPQDEVALVVKSYGAQGVYAGTGFEAQVAAWQQDPAKPELIHLGADHSQAEVAAMYRSAHAFVAPFRGEGFALPIVEAMASGLPAIVSGQGPVLDYADADSATLLPVRTVPFQAPPPWETPSLPGGYSLGEVSVGDLAQALLAAVAQPEAMRAKADRALARVRAQLSWDASAQRAHEALMALHLSQDAAAHA